MNEAIKAPWHLWVIGVVSLLWNAIGANDYVQTRMRNMEYLGSMGFDEEALAYLDSFPVWVDAAWAFGVWGAVIGSILLLLRSRYAVVAFALSLVGAFLSNLYAQINEPPAVMDSTVATVMTVIILFIAIGLLWYSRRMTAAGVLR